MFGSTRNKAIAALVAAIAAVTAPAAYAMQSELGSPSSGSAEATPPSGVDLRSPDARDATRANEISRVKGSTGIERVEAASSDFDWGDAGLGAAVALGLVGLGALAVILVGRHRGRHGFRAAAS